MCSVKCVAALTELLTLNCANYFIARRRIRCYRAVTLRNRGLYKQVYLYTPVFDSSVFDGL